MTQSMAEPGQKTVVEVSTGSAMAEGRRYLLTLGFGTTVAMWALGYLTRMPPAWVPGWVLGLLFLGCFLGGGIVTARLTGRGWTAGAQVGLLASVLNLLILGSLLSDNEANRLAPSALWWVPGSLLVGAALGGLGGLIGRSDESMRREPVNWTGAFARVAAAATLLLLVAGGLVTSHQAGLAVVDWPNSFGYNMFLYPLARMTGGIYYEHAHRLFGALVGLTTLVLAFHLLRVERRGWVKAIALTAVGLVIVQGIMGGLRVTGRFTTSTSPAAVSPSLTLAVIHGITGQLFFALMAALAAFNSTTWTSRRAPTVIPAASTDRGLIALLVLALLVQLVLGALLRHTGNGTIVHISMATVVTLLAVAAGVRAAGLERGQPVLKLLGRLLLIGVGVQLILGMVALVAIGMVRDELVPPVWDVWTTTTHQATGALLLATATLLMVWTRRLLRPE